MTKVTDPAATTKAAPGPTPRHAAPTKARTKTGPAKKKARPTRKIPERSKTDTILGLLRRRNGVMLTTIMAATGWQAHSVRGFISLAISRRGLEISSVRNAAGERVYRLVK